jgi:hypothetical protein
MFRGGFCLEKKTASCTCRSVMKDDGQLGSPKSCWVGPGSPSCSYKIAEKQVTEQGNTVDPG